MTLLGDAAHAQVTLTLTPNLTLTLTLTLTPTLTLTLALALALILTPSPNPHPNAQLPALGLGVSTAFGDIEELISQIDRHGLSQKALRWYERCRMPACAALQIMSRSMYGLNKISANR